MTDTQLPKALQLAELMQAAVQTYPQQSEDEPGGYCTQVDQLLDEAAAELIRLDAREDELLHHVCVLQGMNDESLESIRALTAELEQARAALAAQGEPVAWRELCRRLYVELWHCDKQMTSCYDSDGEPLWTTGAEVRDVLNDALVALESSAPPAPAKPMTDEDVPEHVAILNDGVKELDARECFESQANDSFGFKRSVRGTYMNPAVARDWKWFQIGAAHARRGHA